MTSIRGVAKAVLDLARRGGASRDPVDAYLSLGTNVLPAAGVPEIPERDDAEAASMLELRGRLDLLRSAVSDLSDTPGIEVVDVSGVYETAPVGGVAQPNFLNCCAAVRTTLSAYELLAVAHRIEAAHGRHRDTEVRWGPRTLDIDVLLHGDTVVDDATMTVPHPRMTERLFVLVPLVEVGPGLRLPDGTSVAQHLGALAPIEGIELVVRPRDWPGVTAMATRPDGPSSPKAMTPEEYARRRPRGAPPGTER